MTDHLELTVDTMGAAGDGTARTPDGLVFLPQTLPGERVRATRTGKRGDAVAARAETWLSESPDRVAPPCAHFPACGGWWSRPRSRSGNDGRIRLR